MVVTSNDNKQGSIRYTEFLVLHFLRFRPFQGYVSFLLNIGWSNLDEALRFMHSIQWFITYLLCDKGPSAFIHRGRVELFSLLSTNTMHNTWKKSTISNSPLLSCMSCTPSSPPFLYWDVGATKMFIYY